jgi:hypothetical protein
MALPSKDTVGTLVETSGQCQFREKKTPIFFNFHCEQTQSLITLYFALNKLSTETFCVLHG